MTRSIPEQPDPALEEELVAYLDGELDPQASEAIERRVQHDEVARYQLQQFDRVWNALDGLPRPQASETFTRTTLEMIAADARQELVQATAMLPVRRRTWRLQVAAVCAASLVLGFTLLWLMLPNPNRMLYANLPIIEQVDVYAEFRDIEFLRELDRQGPWLRTGARGEEAKRQAETIAQLTAASMRERKEYVEQLDANQQTALANKTRRYMELSAETRQELADRYEQIRTASDGQQLQQTAFAYYAWLSRFSEIDHAKLRWLDRADRLAEIERMNEQLVARQNRELTDENAKGLRTALQQMAEDAEIQRLQEAFVESFPNRESSDEQRQEFVRRSRDQVNRWAITWVLRMTERDDQPLPAAATEFRHAVEERLLAGLDEHTASELRERSAGERGWMLSHWLWNLRRERPDVATLEDYFQSGKFTQEEKYQLLSMPRDQMYQQLESLYMAEQMGDQRGGRRRGFGDWGRWERPPLDAEGERPGAEGDDRRGRGRRDRNGEARNEAGPRNGTPRSGAPPREFPPNRPSPRQAPPSPPGL